MTFSIAGKKTPVVLSCPSGSLICHKILRHLPGKRIVFKAACEDEPVIVKCFIGKWARRHYLRELRGTKALIRSGIATAELFFHGKAIYQNQKNHKIHVVVTRFINASANFSQLWAQNLSDNQRLIWLYRVVRMLGQLYMSGAIPVDIHTDNLLVCDQHLCLIDGGGIIVNRRLSTDKKISRKKALDNFVLFISVLAPRYEKFVHKMYLALTHYIPEYAGISLQHLILKIHKKRKWRERYLEKTLRSCSDFIAKKQHNRFEVVQRAFDSPELQTLLSDPDKAISAGQLIKQGRTNTVALIHINNRSFIIKRYKSNKRFRQIKMLQKSRARTAWQGAFLLKMLDINTPEPLALLEQRWGPLVKCSYLILEYIPGIQLTEYFKEKSNWFDGCGQVVDQIKDILSSLERSWIAHRDLKATNFLVLQKKVFLIDLDSLHSCKTIKQYNPLWEKDCERFMKNWQHNQDVAALFHST
ncbi:MAG: hypothetical protein OXC48_05460 [Endozoicomonadaceae bacterium]|nr:hypothetical protein [Endozoicomonadaceae bacterium]